MSEVLLPGESLQHLLVADMMNVDASTKDFDALLQKPVIHIESSDVIWDEFRNMSVCGSIKLNPLDWRWPYVGAEEWLLGKRYLNLSETIRKPVLEDVCDFFQYEMDNPWQRLNNDAVFCEGIGCHAKGTKVIKYDGSLINVEDVQVGDKLMGDDSTSRKVLVKRTGSETLYKITPIKGEPFIVNESHILSLKRTSQGIINKHRNNGGKKDNKAGEIINISIKAYLDKSDKFKKLHKLRRVGIEVKKKEIFIPPYFLGCWLGDGNSSRIGITTIDKEIREEIYRVALAFDLGVTINQNKNKACPTYMITGQRIKPNSLYKAFCHYKLINNKHIPKDFLINDRETRLELLAGLIDTDGHLSKSNMEFSNKNKKLCEDVLFLCRSLGLSAYMTERFTSCKGKKFKSYRISISGDLLIIPTRLKRKQSKPREQKKDVLVTGFKIEKLNKGNYYGFTLDKNHLYLTSDFIVHHNSGKSFKTSCIATYFMHLLLCLRHPQRYFGIDATSKIAVMNMSVSEKNAKKVIFSEVASKIAGCEWFQERPWIREDARVPDPNCLSELRFKNNIFIIPGSSSWRSAVGYNVLVGIVDEAANYRSTDNTDQAQDIHDALQRRIGSRFEGKGAIIVAGSPLYENDFLQRKLLEGLKGGSKILARRRPLWESKYGDWSGEYFYVHRESKIIYETKPEDMEGVDEIPRIPFIYKAFKANPTKAYRDYGAVPSSTINAFFENPSSVIRNINTNRLEDPIDYRGQIAPWFAETLDKDVLYHIHVDLAITGDAAGFAMGHEVGVNEEGSVKIYIDLMLRLLGSREAPIQISKVREYIYALTDMGFQIGKITFDGFQSSDCMQILQSKGYTAEYLSVDRTTLPYNNLKETIYEGRLDYYCITPNDEDIEIRIKYPNEDLTTSEIFIKELMGLEDIQGKKVDHTPGGSKDIADAVCGVVHNIVEDPMFRGCASADVL